MALKIKILLFAMLAIAVVVLALFLRRSQDDGTLAATAVHAVTGEKEALNRVTKTTFRMSPASATLCVVLPTQQPPHVGYHCHVFANERALEPIQTGKGTYPVGSVIVKQKYNSRRAKQTVLFTLMRKMESGYDAENGDWEYSVVDSARSKVLTVGREASCIACHESYADTDFVTREYLDH